MNRWEGIHEFVHVVEAGSFTAAAQCLGVSTSQISKQIARLEERLHARLFNRSTRRVALTEEGELYYHRCKRILESLQSAEEDIGLNRHEARGNVHIAISSEIGETPFTTLIARFLAEHPQLSIEVSLSDGCGDLIGPGHDLAIWCGQLDDSSLIARKLCDTELIAVASPAYLARHSIPRHPDDLARHNCLVSSNNVWTFSDGDQNVTTAVAGNWRSPHVNVRLAAACDDIGIALLPLSIAREAIVQKRLVPLLAEWCRHRESLWAVYPQNRYLAARVRLLLDFLIAEFAEQSTESLLSAVN
jgi:DNA-binding transcriptional LysR family regulator